MGLARAMANTWSALGAAVVVAATPAEAAPRAQRTESSATEPEGAALRGCPNGLSPGNTLVVGYEEAAPFAFTLANGDATGFAVDLLEDLVKPHGDAGGPDVNVTFVALGSDALRSRLRGCSIDVAVVGEPMSAALDPETEYSLPYLETAAVIAVRRSEARREGFVPGAASPGWLAVMVVGGGALSAAILAAIVMLLNVRVTWTRGEHPPWAVANLDPEVRSLGSATRWLTATHMGRFALAGWFLAGAIGSFVWGSESRAVAGVPHATAYDAALTAAVSGALPASSGRSRASPDRGVGVRRSDGAPMACGSVADCLRELEMGHLDAVAGNRDALCAARCGSDPDGLRQPDSGEVVFAASPTLPERYAFVFPRGGPWRSVLDAKLLQALAPDAASRLNHTFEQYSMAPPWSTVPYACKGRKP